jgi:hypothetical protein
MFRRATGDEYQVAAEHRGKLLVNKWGTQVFEPERFNFKKLKYVDVEQLQVGNWKRYKMI